MSTRYEIKKSYTMAKVQTAVVAVVALLLFLTTSRIVRIVDGIIPANTRALGNGIRLTALIIGVLCIVVTWVREQRRKYFLDGNRIIVRNSGLAGKHSEEVITPQHASKLQLVRSFFGNKFGYGTVIIEVDSFSRKSTYALTHIAEPEKVIAELQARL